MVVLDLVYMIFLLIEVRNFLLYIVWWTLYFVFLFMSFRDLVYANFLFVFDVVNVIVNEMMLFMIYVVFMKIIFCMFFCIVYVNLLWRSSS